MANQPDDQTEADDWRNPNVSFTDKLNRHFDQKRKTGVLTHASSLNKIIPWFFLFVCLGGSAWIVVGAAPFHYQDNPYRLIMVEVFTIYVFFQVFINWLFLCYTMSPYIPAPDKQNIPNSEEFWWTQDHGTVDVDNNKTLPKHAHDDGRSRTGLTYRVMVVTQISGNKPQREAMPYWSWVPCFVCRRPRPPRCHHCTLCNQCVLKRDHHCYFARNCIGVNNQRYFIYFLIWCVVLCSIGCFQLIPFIIKDIIPRYSYVDLIAPFNVYRVVVGELPILYFHLVVVTWGVVFLTFVSWGMCVNTTYLMLKGLTKFESTVGIKIVDTRPTCDKVRSVMGRNWAVGLFIPGAASFSFITFSLPISLCPTDPEENPVEWPHIKP